MDVELILQRLDELFKEENVEEATLYLTENISAAIMQNDTQAVITLLNELIGLNRESGNLDQAVLYSKKLINLLDNYGLDGTVHYASSLINAAGAFRAAKMYKESMAGFRKVSNIYEKILKPDDYHYASFNNSLSLLYQDMNEYEKSYRCLNKALAIVTKNEDATYDLAVTYTNMGNTLRKLGKLDEAMESISNAIDLFEILLVKDIQYAYALIAMADTYYDNGNTKKASEFYEKALLVMSKRYYSSTTYKDVQNKLNSIYNDSSDVPVLTGINLCESYYREYVRPMIKELFSEYEDRIAIGLCGPGSECFMVDDEYSRDHDFGPGIIMWLTDDDYDTIGMLLQKEYDKLPRFYKGATRSESWQNQYRGVVRIEDFFKRLLYIDKFPQDEDEWLYIDESMLACAVNGKIFRDDLGKVTELRERLMKYYPKSVILKKLVNEMMFFSQTGQYNYERMLKREDSVTTNIILSEFASHTFRILFILNRRYAPYYKWLHAKALELPILKNVVYLVENLYEPEYIDERIKIIGEIADSILKELKNQGYISQYNDKDVYLENYIGEIIS